MSHRHPRADLLRKPKAASFGQQDDFPRRDGGNADAVRLPCLHGCGARIGSPPPFVFHGPDRYVRVEETQTGLTYRVGKIPKADRDLLVFATAQSAPSAELSAANAKSARRSGYRAMPSARSERPRGAAERDTPMSPISCCPAAVWSAPLSHPLSARDSRLVRRSRPTRNSVRSSCTEGSTPERNPVD